MTEKKSVAWTPEERAWYAEASAAREAASRKVAAEHPDLFDQAHSESAPTLRLLCAKGHELLPVTARVIEVDDPSDFFIVPTDLLGNFRERQVAFQSDPARTRLNELASKANDYGSPKTAWRCPRAGCTYDGRSTQEQLILLYVYAVTNGLHEVRLPF